MKIWKKILLVIFILLLLITPIWLIVKEYYLVGKVHDKIEQTIAGKIENDFEFTLDDFKVNIFTSKAQLCDFSLLLLNQTDTIGYFKGDINVDIQGWINILFDDKKVIKHIVLEEAELYYASDHPLRTKSKRGKDAPEIKIANVSAGGKLLFAEKHEKQSGQLATAFDVAVALDYNTTDEFSVDQLLNKVTDFQISQIQYYLPDGFYQLKIDKVAFSEFDDIVLKQIIINPLDSRKTFAKKKKVATDYISVSIDSIQLQDFDSQVTKHVFIDQIQVYQPSIDAYRDKNFPDSQKYKALMVDMLSELETNVYIRKVKLDSMFIKYAELVKDAEEAGELYFSEANANISNITNVKDSVERSGDLLIEAEAKFYGKGLINTSISYELLSETGQFNIKGSLSPMDVDEANAMLSKLAPAKIRSGQVDKLQFYFTGTRIHSFGKMWFEYTDLEIELLEADYWNDGFSENVLNNAGNMVLKNSNPTDNNIFRVGAIDQDRDTTKSMFNYWWISLKSGFISSVGMADEKKEIDYETGEKATFFDKIGL